MVAEHAARQHSMVSVQQLHEAGFDPDTIKRRKRAKRLHHVTLGVYSVAPEGARPALAAEAAAILACSPDGVISHRSAAAIWGLVDRDDTTVDVTTIGHRRSRDGLVVHRTRSLPPSDVRTRERLPVTAPYRTIADLAPHVGTRMLTQVCREALFQRLVTEDQLRTIPRTRDLLSDGPIKTRSTAEELALRLIRQADLPRPQTNVRVHGTREADLFWPAERVIVEIDGYQGHGNAVAFRGDRTRDADHLVSGTLTVRATWRDLRDKPLRFVARVAGALAVGAYTRAP